MMKWIVVCHTCGYSVSHDSLGAARIDLARHRNLQPAHKIEIVRG